MHPFTVMRGARVEALADALVASLRTARPADPFAPVEVVVGSRGMERWLRNRLAVADQICANLRFPFPLQALGEAYGVTEAAAAAWSPDALAWTLAAHWPALCADPRVATLPGAPALVPGAPLDRDAWAFLRELADAVDRASLQRPDWLAAWMAGGDHPEAPPWLSALWRGLRAVLPEPPAATLLCGTPLPGPPLHIFALSAIPAAWIAALGRLRAARPVVVYHLSATNAYVGDYADRRAMRRLDPADAEGVSAAWHPLLASLGTLSRDQLELLLDADAVEEEAPGGFDAPGSGATRVLSVLQDDLRSARGADALAALRAERPIAADDDSVRIHVGYGPTREVEALRETLLGLLDDHPHLQPRDIVVMTPDVATYAPLVRAVFAEGAGEASDRDWGDLGGPRLPTAIADLGLDLVNPLAEVLLRILALSSGRWTANAGIDLAALAPVRTRFDFSDDDLAQLRGWLQDGGARLGADAEERRRLGLLPERDFTLAFALDRLALGAVLADEDGVDEAGPTHWAGLAPFDALEGEGLPLFGRFAEWCARLEAHRAALRRSQTMASWIAAMQAAVADLTAVSAAASFLSTELAAGLDAVRAEASAFDGPVAPEVLPAVLAARFALGRGGDRPTTGAVTVCALAPMRSVPFRVVVLLGMNDGAFPRQAVQRPFDVLARRPRRGDRDIREEDRNLLLECLLSAREHLVISYTGQDPRGGRSVPPAGPIAELLEVIDASFASPAAAHAPSALLTVRHAVQPFSASGFRVAVRDPHLPVARRYDRRMRAAALALAAPEVPPVFLTAEDRFPDLSPPAVLELDALVSWLKSPVEWLLRERMGLRGAYVAPPLRDREPVAVDALERWSLRTGLGAAWLRGQRDRAARTAALRARGQLPVGAPGRVAFDAAWQMLEVAVAAAGTVGPSARRTVSVTVDGVRLTGAVAVRGAEIVDLSVDDAEKPSRLLRAWVQLVGLHASGHADIAHARVVGVVEEKGVAVPKVVRLGPPPDPLAALAELVAIWREARQRPLPLFEKCSYAAAAGQTDAKVDGLWRGSDDLPGEGSDPMLSGLGAVASPRDLPDFAAFADRLWNPLRASVLP